MTKWCTSPRASPAGFAHAWHGPTWSVVPCKSNSVISSLSTLPISRLLRMPSAPRSQHPTFRCMARFGGIGKWLSCGAPQLGRTARISRYQVAVTPIRRKRETLRLHEPNRQEGPLAPPAVRVGSSSSETRRRDGLTRQERNLLEAGAPRHEQRPRRPVGTGRHVPCTSPGGS